MSENPLTVDEILKLDDEPEQTGSNRNSELEDIEVLTQHTAVTSPWSRIGIIGVPLGVGFLIFYLMFNNIINGQSRVNKPETPEAKSAQLTPSSENEDGDVYAQLALSKQQAQLDKINQQKEKLPAKTPPEEPAKAIKSEPSAVQVSSTPIRPRTNSSPPTYQPVARTQIVPRRSFAPSRVSNSGMKRVQKTVDPTAEFNRLRSIGSYGLIAYADSSIGESTLPDPADTSSLQTTQVQPQPINIDSESTSLSVEENTNTIEKIRPRWQVEAKTTKSVNLANNYLPQESQIREQRKTRYLTVGEFATGVLVTPLVKQQDTKNNQQQTEDGRRFVAKLTQDLRDNYGEIAIPKGTLLAVELVGVDGGNYATANVRSIIKDNTEYPLTPGAISLQGDKGKPLIAKKFQDKGGAASYDVRLGLVGGLAKVGEIINQPDSQSTIQQSSTIGSFSSAVTQNNRRNIAGAFLNGAFDSLLDMKREGAARSTQETLARPNVWHIPRGTKITFIVNRTLELP